MENEQNIEQNIEKPIEQPIEQPIKRGKGRPRKYGDITAKERLNEIKYFTDYYRAHKDIKIDCPHCGEKIMKYVIQRHMRTKKCQKKKNQLTVNV